MLNYNSISKGEMANNFTLVNGEKILLYHKNVKYFVNCDTYTIEPQIGDLILTNFRTMIKHISTNITR